MSSCCYLINDIHLFYFQSFEFLCICNQLSKLCDQKQQYLLVFFFFPTFNLYKRFFHFFIWTQDALRLALPSVDDETDDDDFNDSSINELRSLSIYDSVERSMTEVSNRIFFFPTLCSITKSVRSLTRLPGTQCALVCPTTAGPLLELSLYCGLLFG
jgi:hypothetical protein